MICSGHLASYEGAAARGPKAYDADSVGEAESSGCFRMRNTDVADLYKRVPVGTTVVVK